MVSVVIPAHNEAGVVGRLLGGLLAEAEPGEIEIWVVANGCTDDTAEVAGRYGPDVNVLVSPVPNKHAAMRLADEHAKGFPRLYVDADVELGASSVRAIAAALEASDVLAAGPERGWPADGRPWTVRWFYDVWHQFPTVRTGLFGRGVVGVSQEGYERLRALPPLQGDDLAASLAFPAEQRRVVPEARAVVHPPRSLSALLKIRTRALVSTAQAADDPQLAAVSDSARTSWGDLRNVALAAPVRNGPKVAWFLGITIITRLRARRAVRAGDFKTWHRDETTREA
ncbi:glycosyltransferase [Catenulispora yoronensis]|uniref:4,4'-diaponeurosporenoate glycosyltransferase n=1 Tax=Catenulispora yoronensis TaxID=450799 RepID=A0ABN2TYF8_9ACTN